MTTDTVRSNNLDTTTIGYIDDLTSAISRAAAMLRGAIGDSSAADRDHLITAALESVEAGEAASKAWVQERLSADGMKP